MIISPLLGLKMVTTDLIRSPVESLSEQILGKKIQVETKEIVSSLDSNSEIEESLTSDEVLEKWKEFMMREILKEAIFFPNQSDDDEELNNTSW